MKQQLIIGTRNSKLALWQSEYVARRLREQYPQLDVKLKEIMTKGDRILEVPLAKIGGKGLFTKELEVEMLHGDIDIAVHSLKDMPTALPEGLVLAAVSERLDCGDALVSNTYKSLDALPQGATVGTSSLRRKAQLLNYRPDLQIHDLRGNVNTRLRKLDEGQYDAIVLAVAGLQRLGFGERITQIIPRSICLPAVGQGALAIEAPEQATEVRELLQFLDSPATRIATTAERSFLAAVEGGCQVPVGVYGEIIARERLRLTAMIGAIDGSTLYRQQLEGSTHEAIELGLRLAKQLLAAGGLQIMQSIGLCI